MKIQFILAMAFLAGCIMSCGEMPNVPDDTEKKDSTAYKKFINTIWYSQELQYSYKVEIPNNIVLSFSADKVDFNLPQGDGMLASDLLHERGMRTPTHYNWGYTADANEIILDPDGYKIHLIISGDSLI
jgi:hypothetical protein